ncbi:MAG: hypothetical protein M3Y87_04890 [Myxococcota bacterium]|nr:hypothetical protein [Myxococcota bacterium]
MTIPLSTEQAREIGGLLLSGAQVENAMLILRAAHWRNALVKVGLPVPFWVVHDLGMLLIAEPDAVGARQAFAEMQVPPPTREAHHQWLETLKELVHTEVAERSRGWRIGDDLVSVILLRVLGPIYERHLGPGRPPIGVPLPLDPEAYQHLGPRLPGLFAASDRNSDRQFLVHLARERLRLVTSFEQIDLDTLRLLGMMGAEASAASAFGMLDLLNVLGSPDANDVVNFSLDLLPSVLETRRATGSQTFSVDGYAGLARRGTLDSLMLSELAWSEDLFDQRFMENEVFYYAREKQREDERRMHYIVCDATASMRGQRSVFARGLALTLVKKLMLRGEDVFFRFFDSRLYDVQHARARRRSDAGVDVPYVLSFKGEHGRNYAKVFGLLASDLARTAKREKKTPILYILTHAECHVPLETIERLRDVAMLYGIFMLPSTGKLDLDYVHRLHTVQIVDEAALTQREARADRALAIIDDAAGEQRTSMPPGRKSLLPSEAAQVKEDLAAAEAELEEYLRPGPPTGGR